jgi:hypothetical protein
MWDVPPDRRRREQRHVGPGRLASARLADAACDDRLGGLSDRWGIRLLVGPQLVVGAVGLVLVGVAGGQVVLVVGVAYGGLQRVT